MQKLHENVDTDEFEDRSRNAEEIVIKEHFSPGQLIWLSILLHQLIKMLKGFWGLGVVLVAGLEALRVAP